MLRGLLGYTSSQDPGSLLPQLPADVRLRLIAIPFVALAIVVLSLLGARRLLQASERRVS